MAPWTVNTTRRDASIEADVLYAENSLWDSDGVPVQSKS